MAQTTTSNNDNMLLIFLQKRLLSTLLPKAHFYQLAEKYDLPNQSGKQMTFNAWRRINPASSVLSETTQNTAVALSSRKVNGTIVMYGRHCELTDLAENTLISSPTQGALDMLMSSMALTVDNVVQLAVFKNDLDQVGTDTNAKTKLLSAYMSALASAFCANTGTMNVSQQFGFPAIFGTSASRLSAVSKTAPSVSARFGAIAVRRAVGRLQRMNAEKFADGFYYGVIHPNAMNTGLGNSDLKQWFLNWSGGPQQSMFAGEVTAPLHGVKFLISTNVPRYAVAAHSVNATPVFGRQAVGCINLDGGTQTIIKRPGPQSTNDPYNLLAATVAFKAKQVAVVLNPSAGVILFTHELL